MNNFEKRLNEQRQVRVEEWDPVGPTSTIAAQRLRWVYYRTQDLWKVQTGPVYISPQNGPPKNPEDVFMYVAVDGAVWMPCKHEWRWQESVSQEEARKDSQL